MTTQTINALEILMSKNMKSNSKNPIWFNAKLEQSCARLRMFKVLEAKQCEITIRPDSVYVDLEDGNVSEQQGIGIFVSDSGFGNNHIDQTKKFTGLISNFQED